MNNDNKLEQITNPKTKEKAEQLREKVIKFSQNNKVISDNPEIENLSNDILKTFPELRTQIGKIQHSAHSFDIFRHSLKVIQKIVQNPQYDNLSESDKRVMLISALFHDQNKKEGVKDKLHAQESAFDAYYIINKLNLTNDEKNKIYTLIKHHEWLGYVNSPVYTEETEKKQQSCAYALQYDNLFEMAKIFTVADLKAIKQNDEFYNKFKSDFDRHTKAIEEYIEKLKR